MTTGFSSGQVLAAATLNAAIPVKRVRVATTGNGTLASSFANGSVVDGVTLATGDRILLKDQTTGADNGIYDVAASGAPTRSLDFDSTTECLPSTQVVVAEGTSNKDSIWQLTNDGTITPGTTAMVWFPVHLQGAGSPEGVVTAPIGGAYRRTDGAVGSTLYVKSTGTGNTGWVAVTAAALTSASAAVATSESTTATSPSDLVTSGPAVTLTTGTKALVWLGARMYNTGVSRLCYMDYAISGATTLAATQGTGAYSGPLAASEGGRFGFLVSVTGLTAGSNTFTAKYSVNADTGFFQQRTITVIDLGS